MSRGIDIPMSSQLTIATFNRKKFLGIYSSENMEAIVRDIAPLRDHVESLLGDISSSQNYQYQEKNLYIFPDILIGI
ncbi:hypothetical protein CP10139811_0886 [Chlamydia ibidis]|uniref:Uncharacterized protein n=1 Tax=Chlamydia ibidis TaxID=1405396 RepID=S7J4A6_9CHLA|nr:hypothetical protein CP10139811_0886 [Chlamydia ibidis]